MRCIYYKVLRAFSLSSILALAACNAEDAGSLFNFVIVESPAPTPVVDPVPDPDPDPDPAEPVAATLEQVQEQVFSVSCAGSSCHDAAEPAAGLALDSTANSYAGLVNIASSAAAGSTRVIPEDPDNSYLVRKLEGSSDIVGQLMPRGGAQLSLDLINLVRGWIAAGAEPADEAVLVAATLEEVQAQIFSVSCAGSSCHDAVDPAAGLALDSAANSYAGLVNIASSAAAGSTRVVPNDPDNSYLVKKLEGASDIAGQLMPRGGAQLSLDSINLVRGWIAFGAEPAEVVAPEPATLEEVQEQVFNVSCAGSSCHDSVDPAAGLALDTAANSYAGLVNVGSIAATAFTRVIPNDPDNSYLVKKLEGSTDIVGQIMPRGGAQLSLDSINLVRGWIFAGAEPAAAAQPSVTFTEIQEQVFAVSCAGCHSATLALGGLALDSETTSYNALVNVPSAQQGDVLLVDPGNPDDSYLMRKMQGDAGISNAVMPPTGALGADILEMVRTWITEGALQSSAVATKSRVIKTKANETASTVVYRLQLSAYVDSSSVAEGAVQVYILDGANRYLADQDDVNVAVVGPELVVTYDTTDVVYDSLELELNNPEIASMLDSFGSTVEGGTFEYISVSQ